MNIVSIESISKSFGMKTLFDQISLGIHHGDRIGIIGVNGTGKSTFLKVVAGLESPDSGTVSIGNDIRIEYLAQNPAFHEEGAVLDQIFVGTSPAVQVVKAYRLAMETLASSPDNASLQNKMVSLSQQMDAMNAWDLESNAKAVLTRLGITNFSQPVSQLSGGQRKRVAMARALINPADLLILDEPTNHIDNETVEWLEGYLARFKGALLLITHDRYFLDRVVNRIVELDRGQLFEYSGNYSRFLELKAEREEQEAASEDKRQNLLRRELAWLRRGAKARTTKQKARIDRVHALQEAGPNGNSESIEMALKSSRLGKKIIEIDQLDVTVEGRELIRDFTYTTVPGDRVGIVGPNGSGKSTLLNVITGSLSASAGAVEIGSTVKIGYYRQENAEMDGEMRVIDYIKEAAEVIHLADGKTVSAGQMLERFLFPPEIQWTAIKRLSGGEKRRLYLLRVLMGEPNVLLLDEPTNDLDIQTLTVLEDYLDQFDGVMFAVSHDRYFLDRTVDRVFAFEGNGIVREYTGNYSSYIEKRGMRQQDELQTQPEKLRTVVPAAEPKKNKTKLSYKEQREYDQIDDKIKSLEDRSSQLEQDMAAVTSDYERLQQLTNEKEKVDQELEQTIERWAELSILLEEINANK
ncbi:ABC-F family ATP-binding cassette domain-containing protein [Aneurinibacillus sp. Ricciae_BoGa-3]|uniref:ABC-F family ATP-binding cassette domain-containing protein n=1 Tax=Aneurinibacillus sp. Ricciae_BoGa-3 TaxID=3022697 RepID=UPI0023423588|nr:ABC-F family ATP-binding cassette domain-containing protein [Aneurinibacillus sp. Ricciae_BoGa-3]WCK52409.1 ABC-F family ATP-binding cassette domain-containing protein [Aneurinibacillus sp. Ricciae_BoGa-3]